MISHLSQFVKVLLTFWQKCAIIYKPFDLGVFIMKLNAQKLFLLDMDGTLYLDDDLFDGTLDFLDHIKKMGARYMFLTNNFFKCLRPIFTI